jgi:hypothetical protein
MYHDNTDQDLQAERLGTRRSIGEGVDRKC